MKLWVLQLALAIATLATATYGDSGAKPAKLPDDPFHHTTQSGAKAPSAPSGNPNSEDSESASRPIERKSAASLEDSFQNIARPMLSKCAGGLDLKPYFSRMDDLVTRYGVKPTTSPNDSPKAPTEEELTIRPVLTAITSFRQIMESLTHDGAPKPEAQEKCSSMETKLEASKTDVAKTFSQKVTALIQDLKPSRTRPSTRPLRTIAGPGTSAPAGSGARDSSSAGSSTASSSGSRGGGGGNSLQGNANFAPPVSRQPIGHAGPPPADFRNHIAPRDFSHFHGGYERPSNYRPEEWSNHQWVGPRERNQPIPKTFDPYFNVKDGELPQEFMVADHGFPPFDQFNTSQCLRFAATGAFNFLVNKRRANLAEACGKKNYDKVDLSSYWSWLLSHTQGSGNGRVEFTDDAYTFRDYGMAADYGVDDFKHEILFSRPEGGPWATGGMSEEELMSMCKAMTEFQSPVLFVYKPEEAPWWHANLCYGFNLKTRKLYCRDSAFGESVASSDGYRRDYYEMDFDLALRSGRHASVYYPPEDDPRNPSAKEEFNAKAKRHCDPGSLASR